MPATTDYSTGFGRHEIYRLQQASTEGSVQVYSSGTKAIFGEGAKQEMKSGSTLDIESGALLNVAGIQRIPSAGVVQVQGGGKLEVQAGGELELEAGSTLNVEDGAAINIRAGGYIKNAIVFYTSGEQVLTVSDRHSVIVSCGTFMWLLPRPSASCIGIEKTIYFQTIKRTTHDTILGTSVKTGFNSTNRHSINASASNPAMLTTSGGHGLQFSLIAASSSIWRITSPISTDKDVGKLILTSATEGVGHKA